MAAHEEYVSGLETVQAPDSRPIPHHEYQYQGGPPASVPQWKPPVTTPVAPAQSLDGDRICGLRKSTFWLLCALVLMIFVAAAAGVAGAMVAKNKYESKAGTSSSAPSSAARLGNFPSTVAYTATINNIPTVIVVTQSPSSATAGAPAATGPGGVTVECPGADSSLYTASSAPTSLPPQRFLRQCDYNYGADTGAKDVSAVRAMNMEECMEKCAKYNGVNQERGCVAVTWVYRGPQGTDYNYCWIKGSVGNVTMWDEMESAILL